MNFLRKTTALILSVLLCISLSAAVLATETGEESESQETTPPAGFTEVNETVYAITDVNIRSGPGTDYTRIGTLPYGHAINRIGIGEDDWSMVLYNGQVAYMFTAYLSYTRPNDFTTDVDDEALMRQIAIANGLTRSDYTNTSWEALTSALTSANWALNGNSQNAADAAEKALRDAISALVRMNYSSLQEALKDTEELAESGELSDLWFQLAEAAQDGKALLTSGNQTAVDAATARINDLLEQIRARVDQEGTPEVIYQEVPVEVPPTDDYCNIPVHRVWPVLFFVSLTVNVALIAVIVIYIHQKKKNRTDDMPLVDYDIMDDTL